MNRTIRVAIITSTAAFMTACAATPVPTSQLGAKSSSSGTTLTSCYGSTCNPVVVASPTPSPSSSVTTGTSTPISLRVGATGYTSTTVTVQTGHVLKIQFTPGQQDQAIAGSGYYAQYSQLGVYITVNGVVQNTGMLSNGRQGGPAQASPVLDYSSAISSTCSGSSTCRQTVTITVDHPNNDYFCLNYGEYCPWAQVYYSHPWHGTLSIETDDTVAL
jgi:hypothetical protein